MKKLFEDPELEVLEITQEDILTSSGWSGEEDEFED